MYIYIHIVYRGIYKLMWRYIFQMFLAGLKAVMGSFTVSSFIEGSTALVDLR